MRGKKLSTGVPALFVLASIGQGQALLDVAFNNGTPAPSGAAVLGSPGDIWNALDASNGGTLGPFALSDSAGNAAGASLTLTCQGAVAALADPSQPLPALTHLYAYDNSGGPITVTLTGLGANQAYNLVLYVASDDASGDNRSLLATVNGQSAYATGNPASAFVGGQNILAMDVTSDATGQIAVAESLGFDNSSGEVDLNGLQLQAVAAPEPGPLVAIGLGVLVIARRRRIL